MRDNAARPARHTPDRRPPLSGKQPTPQTTRKERRAAERRDRFEAARDERRTRAGGGGGGSSFINTKTMTIVGVAIGVLIVVVVAVGQLGNRATGRLKDPGFAYPATVVDGPALGAAGAPVLLEVWEDYQCPFCGRYSLQWEPTLVATYVTPGQVRIQHHDLSILGRGGPSDPNDESTITAKGAYCADQQDGFWPYAHWIYVNQLSENAGDFRRERVTQIAVASGLEEAAFNACMDSAEATAAVTATTEAALTLGINSTPTFRINGGELLRQVASVEELSALIDAELAKASGAPASAPPSTTP